MAKKKPIGKVKQRAIADETYLPKPYIPPIVETLPGITVNAKTKKKAQEDYVNYPWKHIEYLPEVTVQAKTKNKYKNLPNVSVSSKKTPTIKQVVESTATQQYNPDAKQIRSTANPGQTKSQIKQSTNNIKGTSLKDSVKELTAMTQFAPIPFVSIPSAIINSGIGLSDSEEARKRGDELNQNINQLGAAPWKRMIPGLVGKGLEVAGAAADLTDNFGLEQKKNGGWLDNYGEEANANEGYSSAPKEWMGEGYSNVGRDYSPAWGGQFKDGGTTTTSNTTLPPIYTDDPRKVKEYKDSLNEYKSGERWANLINTYERPYEGATAISNSDLDKVRSMIIKEFPQIYSYNHQENKPISNYPYYVNMDNNQIVGPIVTHLYKKPVQPYILQKEPKLKPRPFVPATKIPMGEPSTGMQIQQRTFPKLDIPNVNMSGPYMVGYHDYNTNEGVDKGFQTAEERDAFMQTLREREGGFGHGLGNISSYYDVKKKKTEKKRNGGNEGPGDGLISLPSAQRFTFLEPTSSKLPIGYPGRPIPPSSEVAISVGGENGQPAFLIPSFKYGHPLEDARAEFRNTGEHLGGPFKTWQEADEWERNVRHPYVEKGQDIPTPLRRWGKDFAMGGSLPGSVGFTYARTNNPAPSNGPYAKKTLASADDGIKKKKKQQTASTEPIGPTEFLNSYFQSPTFRSRFSGSAKDYKTAMDIFNYQAHKNKPYITKVDDGTGSHVSDYAFNVGAGIPEDTSVVLSEPQAKMLDTSLWDDIYPHEYSHNIRLLNPNDEMMFAYGDNDPKAKMAYNKWNSLNTNLSFSDWLKTAGPVTHDQRPNENYSDLNALRWLMYKQGIYDTRQGPMTEEHIEKAMKDPYIKKQYSQKRFFKRYNPKAIIKLNNEVAMNDGEEELIPIAQNGTEMSFYQNGLDWKPKTISKDGSKTATTSTQTTFPQYNLPPLELPTSADSSFLRQKALAQQAWLNKNPAYKKTSTVPAKQFVKSFTERDPRVTTMHRVLVDTAFSTEFAKNQSIDTSNDKIAEIKKQLNNSALSPSERLILKQSLDALNQEKARLTSEVSGYKKKIDKNRYQQRELTTGILNPNIPMGTYDRRIDPQNVVTYQNDEPGPYQGDIVEIPQYDPIALKNRVDLTEKELKYRLKVYNTPEDREFYKAKFLKPKEDVIVEKEDVYKPTKIQTTKSSTPMKMDLKMKGKVNVPNLNQKSKYAFTWSDDAKKQQTTYYPTYDLWKEAVSKANTGKPGYNAGMVETSESGDKSSGQALLRGTPQFKRGGWLDDL